jgi:predicted regulator of Ras-like GTPase activity (Roadblock/LC7/MglB family)
MTDDIRALTAELARDPNSLAFLRLGEALRLRGQLDAAATVVRAGLERHPDRADAYDLYARILADAGGVDDAREAWERAFALDPRHVGTLKGLAFVAFRDGDLYGALDRLESALGVDPTDDGVVQALQTVREEAERRLGEERVRAGTDIFAGFEGAEHGLLLADRQGLVLGGALRSAAGRDVADQVAAHVAGAAQEAERAARLLDLGAWSAIVVEGTAGQLHLSAPAPEALLLVKRDRAVPAGRVALLARRAAAAARGWIEAQRG